MQNFKQTFVRIVEMLPYCLQKSSQSDVFSQDAPGNEIHVKSAKIKIQLQLARSDVLFEEFRAQDEKIIAACQKIISLLHCLSCWSASLQTCPIRNVQVS